MWPYAVRAPARFRTMPCVCPVTCRSHTSMNSVGPVNPTHPRPHPQPAPAVPPQHCPGGSTAQTPSRYLADQTWYHSLEVRPKGREDSERTKSGALLKKPFETPAEDHQRSAVGINRRRFLSFKKTDHLLSQGNPLHGLSGPSRGSGGGGGALAVKPRQKNRTVWGVGQKVARHGPDKHLSTNGWG